MKVFIVPPDTRLPRGVDAARRRLSAIASASSTFEDLAERGMEVMRQLFDFDHLIFLSPGNFFSRSYRIFPSYHGHRELQYRQTDEQSLMVLGSYHESMLRICDRDDHNCITLTVLKKYMREAFGADFTLMFHRLILERQWTCLFGLIRFQRDAYGEKDAARLFALEDVFREFYLRLCSGLPRNKPLSQDLNFFSLSGLPGMQEVLNRVFRVGHEDVPILLLGETGVGKEGVASLLHSGSGRSSNPFIKINCGGIPLSLIESKLFGYQKGAFTGADKDTLGAFEMAHTGTLLLDELGELPLWAQAHLLRVLQESVIQRVGSSTDIPVNVRILAATNHDLAGMVAKKRFRLDLLYRLSVFPIYIPALRERPEDIPILLNFFILQQAKRVGFAEPPQLAASEMRRLCAYAWPGNIREMQNAVIRAMLLWNGARESSFTIEVGRNLFEGMFSGSAAPVSSELPMPVETPGKGAFASLRLEDVEREHIRGVLERTGWKITGRDGAAELLDINPSTLRARMRKLKLFR